MWEEEDVALKNSVSRTCSHGQRQVTVPPHPFVDLLSQLALVCIPYCSMSGHCCELPPGMNKVSILTQVICVKLMN